MLSGDIGNDDTVDANGVTVSYTDVVGSTARLFTLFPTVPLLADTVLDGLVLTGSQMAFQCESISPASECSPTLRNLLFSGMWEAPSPFSPGMEVHRG